MKIERNDNNLRIDIGVSHINIPTEIWWELTEKGNDIAKKIDYEKAMEAKEIESGNTGSYTSNFAIKGGDRFVTLRIGGYLQDFSPDKAREVAAEMYKKADEITTARNYSYNQSLAAMERLVEILSKTGIVRLWRNVEKKYAIEINDVQYHGKTLPEVILAIEEKV